MVGPRALRRRKLRPSPVALWLVAALDARGQPGSAFVQGTILTASDQGVRQAFGFEPAPSARLSVRMFGSWGKKRANASSNCAAL